MTLTGETMLQGHKLDSKLAQKAEQALSSVLLPGEMTLFIGKTSNVSPLFDVLVISNFRVLALMTANTDGIPIKREVLRSHISGVSYSTKMTSNGALQIETTDGVTVFGIVPKQDRDSISGILAQSVELPEEFEAAQAAQAAQSGTSLDPSIELLGDLPNAKTIRAIYEHCDAGQLPIFVLSSGGGAGVLAAWADRLMIIKTGGLTSFMAGATGGGRLSTFYYRDINAIEYNSGFVNGVLEILTPSYTGSQTNDFWSAGKNDPWTLSNCLPIVKPQYEVFTPKIQQLRKWVSEAKNQPVIVQSQQTASGLADELKKLVELHAAGILTDEDLAAAKAKLLS